MGTEKRQPDLETCAEEFVLEVRSLKKYFYPRAGFFAQIFQRGKIPVIRAVENVDLAVNEGEVLGIVGESGCGKTTTGLTIVKLYNPTAGEIWFLGENVTRYKGKALKRFRRHAQIIFQDPYESLNPRFTVLDIVKEPLVIHSLVKGNRILDRLVETLDQVGLKPPELFLNRYPHELSGGQRQRVAIARAMVLRPRFMVADEPVSMLDVSIRAGVLKLLRQFSRNSGLAIVYISHDISTVRFLCDRTVIMYLGRIIEMGPTNSIIEYPMHPYSRALLAAVPLPDPNLYRPRVRLPGEVPSPLNEPSGCVFHPRCAESSHICREAFPKLAKERQGHYVACHLYSADPKKR